MKNAKEIKSLLESLKRPGSSHNDIPRKELIESIKACGFEEKVLYPVLLPVNRGESRGTYNIDKMLVTIEEKSKPKIKVSKRVAKKVNVVDEDLDDAMAIFNSFGKDEEETPEDTHLVEAATSSDSYDNIEGIADYTEDDINEELSMMGTFL
jgi:hypothetical protein